MAYNTEDLYKQAIKAIEKNKLFFIEDLCAYLPCDKVTFYNHFKVDTNEFNTIKGLLEENRIKTKQGLKAKWYKDDNATKQLALYKLIGTDEERKKLSQVYQDHTTKGEKIKLPTIIVQDKEAEQVTKDLLNGDD